MLTVGSPRFYQVLYDYRANAEPTVAYAPKELEHSMVLDGRLPSDWNPPLFLVEGVPKDYQENDLGWRLCSKRMRAIIDSTKSEDDLLTWLETLVLVSGGNPESYYVLAFLSPLPREVLDLNRTLFNPSNPLVVVKPCLRTHALGSHRVFTYEGGFEPWFVSGEVRAALAKARCTGTELAPICQSPSV